jgi:hypothetical protein
MESDRGVRKVARQPVFLRRLADALDEVGVPAKTRDQVMAGSERIRAGATPEQKATWCRGAIKQMDELLDKRTRIRVREMCACCLTPFRLRPMKRMRDANPKLDDFLAAVQKSGLMGAEVRRRGSKVHISFGTQWCVCHAIRASKVPVSVTYCHCCKGHLMGLLAAAFGEQVKMDIIETHISGGKDCRFVFHPTRQMLRPTF